MEKINFEEINKIHIKNILAGGSSVIYDVEKIRKKYNNSEVQNE